MRESQFFMSSNHKTSFFIQQCATAVIPLMSFSVVASRMLTRSQNWQAVKEKILSLPLSEKRKLYKCGSRYQSVPEDTPVWAIYAKIHDLKSKLTKSYSNRLILTTANIVTLELENGAIVNAANEKLLGGGGVDGAIHAAAGPVLKEECRSLNGCRTGEAKITCGYELPAKYVIHTVGPRSERPDMLANCYRNSLDLMHAHRLNSIVFPCISTGIFGYPNESACRTVLETVREWLDAHSSDDDDASSKSFIVFSLFNDVDVELYSKYIPFYFT